jgi:hypothetical protein
MSTNPKLRSTTLIYEKPLYKSKEVYACPFCGGTRFSLQKCLEEDNDDDDSYDDDSYNDGPTQFAVFCETCSATGYHCIDPDDAIDRWNVVAQVILKRAPTKKI